MPLNTRFAHAQALTLLFYFFLGHSLMSVNKCEGRKLENLNQT